MENEKAKSMYMTGLGFVGSTAFILSVLSSPFLIIPMIKKFGHIPWMVTPQTVITTSFDYLSKANTNRTKTSRKLKMIDLGSGDGRICIEAAKWGYNATGYELNPFLYVLSNYNAYRHGVHNNVKFHMKNFWDENLHDYDVITVFGVQPAMSKLLTKVEKEARYGTKIISFRFPINSKTPIWKEGELYIYSHDKK
jgi:hypothetical protein